MKILDETIFARMPSGSRKIISEASARYGLNTSQYARNAILRQLAADGYQIPGSVALCRPLTRKRQP